MTIFQTTINTLSTQDPNTLPGKTLESILSLMLLELDHFPPSSLAGLVAHFSSLFESGRLVSGSALEFVPAILHSLEPLAEVPSAACSGSELQSRFVTVVVRASLSPDILTPTMTMFKDMNLLPSDLLRVLNKVLEILPSLELQELPSHVYNLLLLGSKGHRGIVLKGIIQYFDDLAHRNGSSPAVESTVALHVNFALKQDLKLGKELLKVAKKSIDSMSRFALSLILGTASISRFEDPVLDLIKHGLVSAAKNDDIRSKSVWPAIVDVPLPAPSRLASVLDSVLAHTLKGWEVLVLPLVKLGHTLFDLTLRSVGYSKSVLAALHKRAESILTALFNTHDMVRGPVLEQIFARIIAMAPSADANIALLGSLIATNPSRIIPFENKFKELFNYVSYLDLRTAASLIKALVPVATVLPSFLNHAMLVLKKSLFNRELSSRLVALSGFLSILTQLDISSSSSSTSTSTTSSTTSSTQIDLFSQVAMSQITTPSRTQQMSHPARIPDGRSLALEIMGHLKRCLTQQYAVRSQLYEALGNIIKDVPGVASDVVELIYFQLNKYVVGGGDDTGPPINLDAVVEVRAPDANPPVRVLDDLPGILRAAIRILNLYSRARDQLLEADTSGSLEVFIRELKAKVDVVLTRSASVHAEDYELDKTANFVVAEPAGLVNHTKATVLLGVLEVLMEAQFMRPGLCIQGEPPSSEASDTESLPLVLAFYAKYHELRKRVAETAGTRKGKFKKGKGMSTSTTAVAKALVAEQSRSRLSWTIRIRLLKALFALQDSNSLPNASTLVRHLLLTVHSDLQMGVRLQKVLLPGGGSDKPGGSSALGCSDPGSGPSGPDGLAGFGSPPNYVSALSFVERTASMVARHLVPILVGKFDDARDSYATEVASNAGPGSSNTSSGGATDSYGDSTPTLVLVLASLTSGLALVRSQAPSGSRFLRFIASICQVEVPQGQDEDDDDDVPLSQRTPTVQAALNVLKSWATLLLSKSWYAPLDAVLEMVLSLLEADVTPGSEFEQHRTWISDLVVNHLVLSESSAKKLVAIYVRVHMTDIPGAWVKLVDDVHRLLGGLDNNTISGSIECEIVSDENVTVIVKQVLAGLEDSLAQSDWLVSQFEVTAAQSEAYKELFDALCVRVLECIGVLMSLVQSSMKSGPASDVTIKCVIHAYRTLLGVTKHLLAAKIKPNSRYTSLISKTTELSESVYSLISYLQTYAVSHNSSRIGKELKLIPSLVFAIEQLDVSVLSLSQTSGVNLARNLKRSAVRDFKIRNEVLASVVEGGAAVGTPPSNKRKRKE